MENRWLHKGNLFVIMRRESKLVLICIRLTSNPTFGREDEESTCPKRKDNMGNFTPFMVTRGGRDEPALGKTPQKKKM